MLVPALRRRDGDRTPVCRYSAQPARPPVRVQLWSVRRVLVTVGVLLGAALGVAGLLSYARVADLL